ncbi:MAG: hypothetical protein LBO20_10430 [Bifidobacteriaceae bacterium]|jgi:hypothetical protein|nr:hypothetical protein [Bifidobacteriaceae bacterium]
MRAFKPRTGQAGGDPSAAIWELLSAAFARHGIGLRVTAGEDGLTALLPGGRTLQPDHLMSMARQTDPGDWPELVSEWTRHVLASLRRPEAPELGAEELRSRIRTRVVSSLFDGLADFPYSSLVFPGVGRVLCLDFPESITWLRGQNAGRLALPVEELYRQGQANTDAEPVEPPEPLGDSGVNLIEGESPFTASKAANFGALAAALALPAPHGAVFAIPMDHMILYSTIAAGWLRPLRRLARLAVQQAGAAAEDGPVVSPMTYYWAPNGQVEVLATPGGAGGGEFEVTITPGDLLIQHVLGHVSPT